MSVGTPNYSWLPNQMISLIFMFGFLCRSYISIHKWPRNIVQQCASWSPSWPWSPLSRHKSGSVPASLQPLPLGPSLLFHSVARLLSPSPISPVTNHTTWFLGYPWWRLCGKPSSGWVSGSNLTYHDTDILSGGGGYPAQGFPQQGYPQPGYQAQPGYPAQQPGGPSSSLVIFYFPHRLPCPAWGLSCSTWCVPSRPTWIPCPWSRRLPWIPTSAGIHVSSSPVTRIKLSWAEAGGWLKAPMNFHKTEAYVSQQLLKLLSLAFPNQFVELANHSIQPKYTWSPKPEPSQDVFVVLH